jgi:hypothetical protein
VLNTLLHQVDDNDHANKRGGASIKRNLLFRDKRNNFILFCLKTENLLPPLVS